MNLYSLVYKSSLIAGLVFLWACAIVYIRNTWVHKEQNIKNQRFYILNCKFKLRLNWEVLCWWWLGWVSMLGVCLGFGVSFCAEDFGFGFWAVMSGWETKRERKMREREKSFFFFWCRYIILICCLEK